MKRLNVWKPAAIALVAFLGVGCEFFVMRPLRVVRWSPDTRVIQSAAETPIWIEFSDSVNRRQAEESFTLSGNGVEKKGSFEWSHDGSRITFIPFEPLEEYVRYTIRLDAHSVDDQYGNSLESTFEHEFSTSDDVTRPTVVTTVPVDGTVTDELNFPISVTFSKPMSIPSVAEGWTLSPAVRGHLSWNTDGTEFTFSPYDAFSLQTKYTLSIPNSVFDRSGNHIAEDYRADFTVGSVQEPPLIRLFSHDDDSVEILPTPVNEELIIATEWDTRWSFALRFSHDVDVNSVSAGIQFSPPVSFTLESDDAEQDSEIRVVPDERLIHARLYQITLGDVIHDAYGNTITPHAFYFFTNGENDRPPEVTRITYLHTPASTDIRGLTYGDTIGLEAYGATGGDGFVDVYIRTAPGANVSRFAVMRNFDIFASNNSATFALQAVQLEGLVPAPDPPAGTDEVVARVHMTITDEFNTGMVEIRVDASFADSNDTPLAADFVLRVQN